MSKVLVITGASKGIGHATAQLFIDRNYKVINLSRTSCDIEGVINIKVDLLKEDWAKAVSSTLLDNIDNSDLISVVHNAAMMTKESTTDAKASIIRDVLELNVIAASELNQLLIPSMKKNSSIIYISSTLGKKAVSNTYSYVISKHAVIGQMRATCQDLSGTLIHTACICPGFTETEMLKEHLGKNPEVLKEITATVSHGRLAKPSEIAGTIWFASTNPVINGTVIDANLGQIER